MTEPAPFQKGNTAYYVAGKISDSREDKDDIRSTLVSRNITILGRRTSVRLEPEMWNALRDIARREGCSMHDICSLINIRKNPRTSLTGAIRVFLMLYYRAASTEEGHLRAGHGNFETMKRRAQLTKDLCEYRQSEGSGAELRRGGMSEQGQDIFYMPGIV